MVRDAETIMREALDLAANSAKTAPNPMVGCIILDEKGAQISVGWHEMPGTPHAEAVALSRVTNPSKLASATLYVTLEPCCHQGRTPPCSKAIIDSGIRNVVIGCLDPNPLVAGKGVRILREAGITVTTGVLESACRDLNKRFITYHERSRPYISLKWAETADGFIAPVTGERTAISDEAVLAHTHRWRSQETAIWVGTNTAVIDNPLLTVRHAKGKNPVRILVDRRNRVPNFSSIFNQEAETILFTAAPRNDISRQVYQVCISPEQDPISAVLEELRVREIQSVLVEGGAQLHKILLSRNLWDEIRVITSPKKFGTGLPAPTLPDSAVLRDELIIGKDIIKLYSKE
jgi:diaminohydroxyphosphoribosylaminopyrimidine deaminase/5-amino-6-(5-phosphoribosylamino)uracil reductase